MGKDGFKNEILLIEELNNKKVVDLNQNLQNVIKYIDPKNITPKSTIKAFGKAGINKTDMIIKIENKEYNISIKKGTGNSVHQEKLEEFITFLKEKYDINEKLANDIRFFIWGDETLNGTGQISDRLSSKEFKNKYPEKILNIKNFFHKNKRDLIKRFLIDGAKSESSPDFLYYGTPEKGIIVESNAALDWLSNDENEKRTSPLPVGRLTFQAWNRNINGGNKSEKKRGVIQLKWSSVGSDLKIISKMC
ncbi:hypothetical protein [Methanobrevibacter sp. UBA417]|jgi:hypothetical protein|uniref:hypothetical protein n=1 Tax=Methanobrevibacter sp. UBA417 TaxID=1915487 RepID=UPI0039B8DD26